MLVDDQSQKNRFIFLSLPSDGGGESAVATTAASDIAKLGSLTSIVRGASGARGVWHHASDMTNLLR